MTTPDELYDYDVVRCLPEATGLVVHVSDTFHVLGSTQRHSLIAQGASNLRVRRGGGGVVRIEPDDVWLDMWIPRDDPRFLEDVTDMAVQVGNWWKEALDYYLDEPTHVATSMQIVSGEFAAACFAGMGPGEVFAGSRKLVGVTQWRVREGAFVATLLPRRHQGDLALDLGAPEGLSEHLAGAGGAGEIFDAAVLDFIAREVIDQAGGMTRRELHLIA
jgi:hypothetical protein